MGSSQNVQLQQTRVHVPNLAATFRVILYKLLNLSESWGKYYLFWVLVFLIYIMATGMAILRGL